MSIFYKVTVLPDAVPEAGDGVLSAKFYDLLEVYKGGKDSFAFAHFEVL